MNQPPPARDGPSPKVLRAALDLWSQSRRLHQVPINGQSMLPLLCQGDTVLVAHGSPLSVGDVLVYWRDGMLVAHRLIRAPAAADSSATAGAAAAADTAATAGTASLVRRTYLARGDNLLEPDAPIAPHEIVGRVLAIQRDGRTLWLDTLVWRLAGRLLAAEGLAWTWFCRQAGGAPPRRPGRFLNFLSRGFRRYQACQVRAWLAVAGRWQD